jgi:hypothetical protein
LLQYFVFVYLWVMGLFPPNENLGVQATAYAAIVGPLAIALALRLSGGRAVRVPFARGIPSGEYH